MENPSDAQLFEASWHDPSQFEAVFDRHYEAVRAFLARRVGVEAADDLAATVFLIAFESRRKYDTDRQNARPWLCGIASNLIRRHYRTEKRRLRAMSRLKADVACWLGEDEVVAEADAATMRPEVAAALLGLSRRSRDVLVLIAWEGLSQGEAAYALGIPVGAVRSRLHHARSKLRVALASSGPHLDVTSADPSALPVGRKAEA